MYIICFEMFMSLGIIMHFFVVTSTRAVWEVRKPTSVAVLPFLVELGKPQAPWRQL